VECVHIRGYLDSESETESTCDALQLYASTSYLDDLMLASAWLAKVSGQPAYLAAAETYWDRISTGNNTSWQSVVPNWDNQWWASNVVLTGLTGNPRYQVTSCLETELTPRLDINLLHCNSARSYSDVPRRHALFNVSPLIIHLCSL